MQCNNKALYSTYGKTRDSVIRIFFHLLAVLFLSGISRAAVMPDYTLLAPVGEVVNGPMAVALDNEGRLYVADTGANRIVIFSSSGRYIDALNGLDTPISVAVDNSGRILVGSKEKGSVEVYSTTDFSLLFKLGVGEGEFSWPNALCTDVTGRIYVVDRGYDVVRQYDADGRFTGILGSPGNNNGQFHRPVSIAIDAEAGEVLVLDRQLIPGTTRQGARIQIFLLDGTYLRGFTRNGDQEGGMVTPQGIAVDGEGRIYVTDSYQNAVLVYGPYGEFLGAIYSLDNPLRSPLGITINESNRLYIASRLAQIVDVYGIDQYAGMEAVQSSLEFSATEGGENSSSLMMTVGNTGTENLYWGAVASEAWLTLDNNSGFLEPGQFATVQVAVEYGEFTPGQYTGTITLTSDTGLNEIVQVVMTVEPKAILSLSPGEITLTSEAGTAPAPGAITIANRGSAPLVWTAAVDQPWLKADTYTGTLADSTADPLTIAVSADVISLGPGTYSGTVTVTGENAIASPMTVNVSLVLSETAVIEPPAPADRILEEMNWEQRETIPSITLNDVWTVSGSDIFAVGQAGVILHYNGNQWNIMDSGTEKDLYGVWGFPNVSDGTADVYAVGSGGTILHYDGAGNAWTVMASSGNDLTGVWGTSPTDVYAVGAYGTILHYNGLWASMSSPTDRDLYGIWGTAAADIYSVGQRGTILRYNGATWNEVSSPTRNNLYCVWGKPEGLVHVAGQRGIILRGSGSNWETVDSGTRSNLYGIRGNSASDLYAVGSDGTILNYDGTVWTAAYSPVKRELRGVGYSPEGGLYIVGQALTLLHYDSRQWKPVVLLSSNEDLNDVWGFSGTDVYAVGFAGTIMHYDGDEWTKMQSPVTGDLFGVSGRSGNEVYAAGAQGNVIHVTDEKWTPVSSPPTDRTLYGVWASPETDVFAVGERGTILLHDGELWHAMSYRGKEDIFGVWGRSSADVYMVGQSGTILHYDGTRVRSMESPTGNDLYAIRGCSDNSLFAAGRNGTVLMYDQESVWISLDSGTGNTLSGIWCSSAADVFAAGQNGMLLYYNGESFQLIDSGTDGWLKAIWGSDRTTDIFSVGTDGIIYHGQ